MKKPLLLLFLLLLSLALGAVTVESVSVHLYIKNLDRPAPPSVRENWLVLSLGGVHRFVGVAFAHEGFAIVHPFEKNDRGIFVFAMEVPFEFGEPLAYRLVVDGSWIADPSNRLATTLPDSGLRVSLVDLPWRSREEPGVYEILGQDGRTAHFLYKGRPGELVSVAGSFNNWDPFTHILAETAPGEYRLDLLLPLGLNLYYFVTRGAMVPDPLNVEKASNRYDQVVSVLRVGSRPQPGDPVIHPLKIEVAKGG